MHFDVTYEYMKENHPDAVDALMAKLRGGKSKERTRSPEELTWRIDWAVRVDGFSGKDLAKRLFTKPQPPATVEGRVQDYLSRVLGPRFEAKIGRWQAGVSCHDHGGHPAIFVERVRMREQAQWDDEQRIAAMTDEERAARREEILNELRGTPGFIELHIPNTK